MQYETNYKIEETEEENNCARLTGTILAAPAEDGRFQLTVNRLSGMADVIPAVLTEKLMQNFPADINLNEGTAVTVKGRFQSHNQIVGDRSKLVLLVHAEEITAPSQDINPNTIELTGYICKSPIYRTTPFNREIADLLIAVNRATNRSDYIPAIAWGRNARFAKNLLVGEKIFLSGRIQSREYQKRLDDGSVETRTAFEVSINTLSRS